MILLALLLVSRQNTMIVKVTRDSDEITVLRRLVELDKQENSQQRFSSPANRVGAICGNERKWNYSKEEPKYRTSQTIAMDKTINLDAHAQR